MVPTVEVLLLLPIETRILSDDDGEKGEANKSADSNSMERYM